MKNFTLLQLFLFSFVFSSFAQVSKDDPLFHTLQIQDSLLFVKGFNECDLTYLENIISDELKFYHDQSGIQDGKAFFENVSKYICAGGPQKPIRKLEPGSLVVYPLHNNGKLYGAIQHGLHHFYLREKGKEDVWTSQASFTHVWILDGEVWKLDNVLSYNHQSTK